MCGSFEIGTKPHKEKAAFLAALSLPLFGFFSGTDFPNRKDCLQLPVQVLSGMEVLGFSVVDDLRLRSDIFHVFRVGKNGGEVFAGDFRVQHTGIVFAADENS